ncbi:hypothetical protein EXIGLDRAFT_681038 [Exidia glandulosa HHB12029]|uniref:Response regulatory domain-containing protein n=1 Tax=Exidia glandulosa HHB12029 TaxID=1314781 RepID=A0A165EA32_EXIGL|nr:hypothetical protein EXIGLDRAFT_681038 [Exidia glandulosa HHB12029]
MDIHMPVMDGISATREIRRLELGPRPLPSPSAESSNTLEPAATLQPPGGGSPFRSSVIIVALTASNLESDRIAALAAGCNDYIMKPVSLEWLRQKIMEWGSIKALQMWAVVPATFDAQQEQKALDVASHLKLPRSRTASPEKPSRSSARERSVSPSNRPPSAARSVSSTRSISPSPTRSVAPALAASASEESLGVPQTPEDDQGLNLTVHVPIVEALALDLRTPEANVPDAAGDAPVPLVKTAEDRTTPPVELPGVIAAAELEAYMDSDYDAASSARE